MFEDMYNLFLHNLLLNLLDIGDNNLTQFASKSMITGELNNQMKEINSKITLDKLSDPIIEKKMQSTAL